MSSNNEEITIQDTSDNMPEAPNAIESSWSSFVPMILIFAVFYFLLIRPQEKKRKEHERLVSSVKKGEEIMTNGGIYGKVVKVSESDPFVMVEVSENSIIKLEKTAILTILNRKSEDTSDNTVKTAANTKTKTVTKKKEGDKKPAVKKTKTAKKKA